MATICLRLDDVHGGTSVGPAGETRLLATRAAQAHAGLGDGAGARQGIRLALRHLARDDGSDLVDTEIASHCTPGYVLAHEGYCLLRLGEPSGAIRVYEELLVGWPASQRLDEGLFRANLALAYAMTRAVPEAIDQGRKALILGVETGSRRTMRAVSQHDQEPG